MNLNRRSFLKKTLAAGSVLAGAGSFLAACSGVTRSDMPDPGIAELTHSQLLDIIDIKETLP